MYNDKIPLQVFSSLAEQSQVSQPFLTFEVLHSVNYRDDPWLDSLQCVRVPLLLRSPELDPGLQMWPHQCCTGGRVTSFELPAKCWPVEPKLLLTFFGTRAHCCLALNLLFTRSPQVLSFQAAFQLGDSWYIPVYGRLFLPRCGTSHFSW